MDTREKIISIIQGLANSTRRPAPDELIFESGLLDSFSLINLVNNLETSFRIKIPDSDLYPERLDSVLHIEEYIRSRRF
jgi:acyl carrier protein